MDINKEREAFEVEFSRIKSDIAFWVNTWDEEMQGYNHPVMCWFWHMWLEAKAQAVPAGFVLVEKTKLMQIVGSAAIIEPITRGNPLMSKYKTELDFILSTVRAMIEAQEPAND